MRLEGDTLKITYIYKEPGVGRVLMGIAHEGVRAQAVRNALIDMINAIKENEAKLLNQLEEDL